MQVSWSAGAENDLARIEKSLLDLDVPIERVEAMVVNLQAACLSLAQFPARGRAGIMHGTKELVAYDPYVIVYVIKQELVEIVRVIHSAQDRSEP